MKQDLKELFKEEDFIEKKLPKEHREEFISKLSKNNFRKKNRARLNFIIGVAASFLVLLTVGYAFLDINPESKTEIANNINIDTQLKQIEKEYLINIDKEWTSFRALSKDENLIRRFEQKLNDLDLDYQEIMLKYKKEPNNILVIEDLIDNLSTRLQLLKDIQEHINFINEANV